MARDENSGLYFLDRDGSPQDWSEDTGEMLRSSIGAISEMGVAVPELKPEEIVERAISRVIEKHTGPPRKHFAFGFTVGDYIKGLGIVFALIASYFAMRTTIDDNTKASATNSEKVKAVEVVQKYHEEQDHKALDARIGSIERTVDRVEVKQEQAIEIMQEVKQEVREQRRATRRRSRASDGD